MVTRLKDRAKVIQPCISCPLLIAVLAVIFFGVNFFAEDIFSNNDDVVDAGAVGVIAFLCVRQVSTAMENRKLRTALRECSEELERRVAEKTERIKQMHEAQSKFLLDVSHEFQTPISILRGNFEILGNVAGKAGTHARYVVEVTLDRLSRMVNSVLDIAKLNFSKDTFYKRPVDVQKLLEEARDDCSILAEDRGITLSCSSEKISVLGERDQLKEVLLNLLSNALKYTAVGGSIALIARSVGANAEIVVADSGIGIARKHLPMVFERFYKIGGESIRGTGLGLHICRQIIEAHQGTIVVKSEEGKGSRFIIHLPLASKFPS